MKRIVSISFLAFVTILFVAAGVFALSDADYKKFLDESAAYRNAEKELAAAWKQALGVLKGNKLQELKENQRDWVRRRRDEEASALVRSGYSRVNAYVQVTIDRVNYIKGYLSPQSSPSNLVTAERFTLSDADYNKFLKESPAYQEAEKELAAVWKQALGVLTGNKLEELKESQRNWVRFRRGEEASVLVHSGYSRVNAYVSATVDRVKYIKEYLPVSKSPVEPTIEPLLRSDIGDYVAPAFPTARVRDITGIYHRDAMNAQEFIEVRWQDRKNEVLRVDICSRTANTEKLQVSLMSGRLRGNTVVMQDTTDDNVSIKLVFKHDGGVAITTNGTFKRMTNSLQNRPWFDGTYMREAKSI